MKLIIKINLLVFLTSLGSLQFIAANDRQTQVYIGTGSDGIYSTWLDTETGKLAEPKLAAAIEGSNFIAIHPNLQHLYSSAKLDRETGAIFSYSIAADGSLIETSQQGVQGRSLCHISLDSTQQVLLGANYGQGNVVSFPLQGDGKLGKLVSFHQHEGSSITSLPMLLT